MTRLEQPHGDSWQHREAQRRAARERATAVPTFSECVLGYRAWAIDPFLRLWPLTGYGQESWQPGVNAAVCGRENVQHLLGGTALVFPCDAPAGHAVPHRDCGCGFYSRRRPSEVIDEIEWPPFPEVRNPLIPGAVASWGDLCVHRDGFRASHACIVALATMPTMPPEVVDLAGAVAAKYGVPLVPADELEIEASKSGTPLPDEIGPPEQPPPPNPWVSGPVLPPGVTITYGSTPASPAPVRLPARWPIALNAAAAVLYTAWFAFVTHWWLSAGAAVVSAGAAIHGAATRARRKRATSS